METDFKKKLKIKYNLKFFFHIFFIFIKKFRIIQYLKKNKANYESLFKSLFSAFLNSNKLKLNCELKF